MTMPILTTTLGQCNVLIGTAQSPVQFEFRLRNDTDREADYWFEIDTYQIPERRRCDEVKSQGLELHWIRERHDRSRFPLPVGWSIVLAPSEPHLRPGEEVNVSAVITAPGEFEGQQPINVHAFQQHGLAGGVTLVVQGGA
ncbi:hypothetical protein [Streptomyces sp. NPDC054783]